VSFRKIQSSDNQRNNGQVSLKPVDTLATTMAKSDKSVTHPNVSYQVASKHELEVIYEGVQPKTNKTVFIVIGILAVIVLVGGGAGVALWQSGMLGDQSENDLNAIHSSSKVVSAVDILTNDSLHVKDATDQLRTTPTTVLSVITKQSSSSSSTTTSTTRKTTTTTTTTSTTTKDVWMGIPVPTTSTFSKVTPEPNLILSNKRRRIEDNMLMLVMGTRKDMRWEYDVGEIIGRKRRKKNDDTCGKLEVGSPSFVKYLGSVYLSAIEAIVVCGYTTKFKGNSLSLPVNQQKCYIYYKNYPEWHPVTLFENNVFFEGAFVPWHNKLVLFGGNAKLGARQTITRSIMVFSFNPVRDLFGTSRDDDYDDEDSFYGSGDDDDYTYRDDEQDDEDDYLEGSGDDASIDDVGVALVEDADALIENYGPGAVEACAVTISQSKNDVVFIVTGGKNSDRRTMSKVMKIGLSDHYGTPKLGETQNLSEMSFSRRQHGCTKTVIAGRDILIVAGGLDNQNVAVKEIEFLNFNSVTAQWKIFGLLKQPRFGYPTIGRVMGNLVVVGGKTRNEQNDPYDIDDDEIVAKMIEIYDESIHNFRAATASDNLHRVSLSMSNYNYYGVQFPKQWCYV